MLGQIGVLCAACVLLVRCKVSRGVVKIRGDGVAASQGTRDNNLDRVKFLTKYGYEVGSGTYQFRFRVKASKGKHLHVSPGARLPLMIFLDEKWKEAELQKNRCHRGDMALTSRNIRLAPPGVWSSWENGTLHQSVRPHVWYFVVQNCKDEPLFDDFNAGHGDRADLLVSIEYEAVLLQESKIHFSYELLYTRPIVAFQLVVYLMLAAFFIRKELKMTSGGDVLHPIIKGFNAAIGLQLLATALHLVHLCVYAHDGIGTVPLDAVSGVLSMLSQVVIACILLLIGMGYTLTSPSLDKISATTPFGAIKLQFFVLIVALIHVLLVAVGKLKTDASYQFHENEGLVGHLIIGIRLCLFFWFLTASSDTVSKVGLQAQAFLVRFRAAVSIYFVAHPLVFLVAGVLAQYLRHKFMILGVFIAQLGSVAYIASLFLTKSDFFRLSSVGSESVLGRFMSSGELSSSEYHND